MDIVRRNMLESFCIWARMDIEGLHTDSHVADVTKDIKAMDDEKLEQEADFLDDMLSK